MHGIELAAALAQLQEEIEEEVGLGEEASIGGAFAHFAGKTGRSHAVRHVYGLDGNAGYKGGVAREERYLVAALLQSMREVGQQDLRPTEIGLLDGRNQGSNQRDTHHSPPL